ncbi:hypothetical protein [Flavobacterium sp.]|uniref:hypothetical protein n=1 Tax=Flavobacterium sp. TaxID=239 RepID=UPI00286EB29C|nr:hypothetical protein [Flavobacterium sp.]
METKSSITKYSIIAGVFVSAIFPFLIFPKESNSTLFIQILDFGTFWNPVFWGILFPLFIIFLFWNSAKKISSSLNQISYLKACSQFSFEVSSKLLIALFVTYITGMLINGISSVLQSQIPYQILFSILVVLFLSFLLMIMTFISSLIVIKMSQNPQP